MDKVLQKVWIPIKESRADRSIEWIVRDLPFVEEDVALLHQVWANLRENTIEYTRLRGSCPDRGLCPTGQCQNCFFVADNGFGFDMHYAGKFFGVFQRPHSPDPFEGTDPPFIASSNAMVAGSGPKEESIKGLRFVSRCRIIKIWR